ncbi:MAG: PIG-L family deacetylase [Terracidiphilus sp.]|nr:PIG-L family deacetylase [Terracidiphilus sp.]
MSAYAQPVDRGASGLWQSLQKLKTRASLMMIVAHPDDEDGGMLAYEGRGKGADTTLLSLTRGEGGQNVITGDFWDELGLLRTEELQAASDLYGARLRFTRLADFGFSKSLEEALKTWGHERTLYDVVREVRIERPLIVMSVFAGNVSDGHGHHQTSGVMAQEVYKLAGDPKVFPDQIAAGLEPWSPLKVYARVPFARVSEKGIFDYATGHYAPARFRNYVNGTWIEGVPSATVEIPEGEYNPLFGRSYLALGREGLSQQKSQNDGVGVPPAGPNSSGYHLYASRVTAALPAHEQDFFEGIDTSLAGIADYAPEAARATWAKRFDALAALVAKAASEFDATDPAKCASALAEGLNTTRALRRDVAASKLPEMARFNMDHELATKEAQFNLALAQSLGISLVATLEPATEGRAAFPMGGARGNQPTAQSVVAGEPLTVDLHVANEGRKEVTIKAAELRAPKGDWKFAVKTAPRAALDAGQAFDAEMHAVVPEDVEATKPYFSRPNLEQAWYDIAEAEKLGLPRSSYPLSAHVTFACDGVEASLDAVVQTVHRVNVLGPVLEPLIVAPALSVAMSPAKGAIPLDADHVDLQVRVRSNAETREEGSVQLTLPEGWKAEPATASFALEHRGEEKMLDFRVIPSGVAENSYSVKAIATANGKQFGEGFTTIGYAGLRPSVEARAARYTATGVNVKAAAGLRVGYIMGPGDEVPASLAQIGIHAEELTAQDLASGDLSRFDAILVGIRAYTTRSDLRDHNARLLDYARAGGVVVVEYQTAEFDHNYGPFALSVPFDAERVVEEDGAVAFDASDPLLSWPNRISNSDFANWVEERGHGFAKSWAKEYHAPVEMHDADEEPQRGGLLWARTGKGLYIYAAFAFFREMPEGVPGSFRIMANLISAGKNPGMR